MWILWGREIRSVPQNDSSYFEQNRFCSLNTVRRSHSPSLLSSFLRVNFAITTPTTISPETQSAALTGLDSPCLSFLSLSFFTRSLHRVPSLSTVDVPMVSSLLMFSVCLWESRCIEYPCLGELLREKSPSSPFQDARTPNFQLSDLWPQSLIAPRFRQSMFRRRSWILTRFYKTKGVSIICAAGPYELKLQTTDTHTLRSDYVVVGLTVAQPAGVHPDQIFSWSPSIGRLIQLRVRPFFSVSC